MGVWTPISSDSYCFTYEKLPNPKPNNYIIKKYYSIKNNLVVVINYPDCTNYEGDKVLVYSNVNIKELKEQKLIDPHFSNNKKFKSPFARFEPTQFGIEMAKKLAKIL